MQCACLHYPGWNSCWKDLQSTDSLSPGTEHCTDTPWLWSLLVRTSGHFHNSVGNPVLFSISLQSKGSFCLPFPQQYGWLCLEEIVQLNKSQYERPDLERIHGHDCTVKWGQAYLCETDLLNMENNRRADVAVGLQSELSEGHPDPGIHAVFSSCWEAQAVLLVSLLMKPCLGQMSLILLWSSHCCGRNSLLPSCFFHCFHSQFTKLPLYHLLVTSLLSESTPTANQDGWKLVLSTHIKADVCRHIPRACTDHCSYGALAAKSRMDWPGHCPAWDTEQRQPLGWKGREGEIRCCCFFVNILLKAAADVGV